MICESHRIGQITAEKKPPLGHCLHNYCRTIYGIFAHDLHIFLRDVILCMCFLNHLAEHIICQRFGHNILIPSQWPNSCFSTVVLFFSIIRTFQTSPSWICGSKFLQSCYSFVFIRMWWIKRLQETVFCLSFDDVVEHIGELISKANWICVFIRNKFILSGRPHQE